MALELIDLSLSLPTRVLVAGLNARVEPGQVLTLMGESGCGKSSLLAYLAGSLQPPLMGPCGSTDVSSTGCRSNNGRSACCSRTICCSLT
jgi:ABC-type multidrug transport system ATPase subunit